MWNRRMILGGVVASMAAPATAWASAGASSSETLYEGATLLDPVHRRVQENAFIWVRDGRIAQIGQGRARRTAASVARRDMRGLFVLPGLVDTHAHLTLGPTLIDRSVRPPRISAGDDPAITARNARMMLGFGVTGVRNPGGRLAANVQHKVDLAAGRIVGPRMVTAGEIIDRQPFAFEGLVTRVTAEQPIEAIIAAQAQGGADYIKFYENLTEEDLALGIRTAQQFDLRTVAHLGDVSWTRAAQLGIDALVHMMPISPDLLPNAARAQYLAHRRDGSFRFFEWYEAADLDHPNITQMITHLKRANVTVDATLIVFKMAFWGDDTAKIEQDLAFSHPTKIENWRQGFRIDMGWSAQDYARAKAVWPKVLQMTKKMSDAGVRLTIGTDQGNPFTPPGISMWREMALHRDAGIAPWDILRMATADGADTLGWRRLTGRLRAGLAADLLFTAANPLDDFAAASNVRLTVANGVAFEVPSLRAV